VNPFFEDLGRRLAAAAADRGATISPPELDADVSRELLDLTRVVAHTHERRFGPLAAYLTGVAVGRAEAAGGSVDPGSVAELVHRLCEQLEAEAPASSE
jgi:hypothetical protein